MEVSHIEISVQTNPLGKREAVNHKWVGNSPYVHISLLTNWDYHGIKSIRGEEEIQFGPYRLLKVDDGYFYGDFNLYVRKDKLGALRVMLYKSTRLLDLFYRRMIITLAVWKLADFSPVTVPSWRDIKIFKKVTTKK